MTKLGLLKQISTRQELAELLGIEYRKFVYVVYSGKCKPAYCEFSIPKKNGGERIIHAPNDQLKVVQKKLSDLILDCNDEIRERVKKTKQKQNDQEKDGNEVIVNTLSHGFERGRSIISNAKVHRCRRIVLNFDLKDFFDSFNPGRVRGYFTKNKSFTLADEVSKTIAKIACYNNGLPQGSPCSPVIANTIASILDIRLNKICKKYGCSYSRYADDITISTRKKQLPREIAELNGDNIIVGKGIEKVILNSGFQINGSKTRVEFNHSRQSVTGLIVNAKINTRREYWRTARAQVNSVIKTGSYVLDGVETSNLSILDGRLNFIYEIDKSNKSKKKKSNKEKYDAAKTKKSNDDKKAELTMREETYRKFLYYKYFYGNAKIEILTEGKTDVIYLKCAYKKLSNLFPVLYSSTNENGQRWHLFNFKDKTSHLLGLNNSGGSDTWRQFVSDYDKEYKTFCKTTPKLPVILILDNDKGFNGLLSILDQGSYCVDENGKKEVRDCIREQTKGYWHLTHNLYLILTPIKKIDVKEKVGEKNEEESRYTTIEDLFSQEELNWINNGKKFIKSNGRCGKGWYSKIVFATGIRKKSGGVSFDGFKPIFNAIAAILNDYIKNKEQYVHDDHTKQKKK